MSCPKVSVIVPVYNVEKYIAKCLDSILNQTFEDYEVIAVDDGGNDKSADICEEYASRYPQKVRVIHQENAGLGGARNTGIEVANGEYLIFIDSDDYIAEDMLETLVGLCNEHGADIAVCGIRYITEEGKTWDVIESVPINKRLDIKKDKFALTISPAAWNKIYKRELFLKNNIRYPSKVWFEDICTTTKLFAFADGIVFTDKCLYYYLQRAGSIIHSSNLDRNREIFGAIENIIDYYKENGLYDEYKEELDYLGARAIFWDAPARILKATSKHKLLNEFYDYAFEKFSGFLSNKYFIESVARKGIVGKIYLFCLKHKMYRTLHFILKVKG
ncbi:MAG: glycosyltransferase [Ruminococcaceae bacterium]|nr:glycosyltransferase [Oscillospiraceae bacterium]